MQSTTETVIYHLEKNFCLYDDTFIKCLLFIHNSVGSGPGRFSLESDLIYHFVGLESIRIFGIYSFMCLSLRFVFILVHTLTI